ncbi:MAG: anthranilate phosphoribosyltransferase [Pseudomonadota bacterium]
MSTDTLSDAILRVARKQELPADILEAAFGALLSGDAAPEQIGAFLMGLAVRGETSAELFAGARVMRNHARRLHVEGDVLDTCGTGGLPWKSLNTSTASALVVAAAGGRVAKHGNRSVPPKTGSADVLEALGVNLEIDEATFQRCLDGAGVAFMFARSHHSAMRHVAPIRAKLGIRTIFNLLGPLTNPAGAQYQVLGVFAPEWVRPMADALETLGVKRAWVVHGLDGIDEVSISGKTLVADVSDAGVHEFEIKPSDFGLSPHPLASLEGGAVDDNALAIRELLEGREGPFRDVVVLNASVGLHVFGRAPSVGAALSLATEAIDSGAARDTLRKLAALSNNESIDT